VSPDPVLINPDVDVAEIMHELNEAANGISAAADEVRRLLAHYEGARDLDGEFRPGSQLRWMELVNEHLDRLAIEYEEKGKRPPAKEVLQARAYAAAKRQDEVLWADYHADRARLENLQRWIAAKSKTISARQSILKGERQ
jgi:hypothetical protein